MDDPGASGPARHPRFTLVVCWLLVVPSLVWALVRLFGLERATVAVPVMAFTPYAAAASIVPLAVTVLARRWWAAAAAGLACVVLAACVLPRAVGAPTASPGVELRVMAVNLRVGGADAPAIVELVRAHRVDVLAVQELTPDAEERLDAAGLTGLLRHSARSAADGVGGSALYARYPVLDIAVAVNPGGEFRQVSAGLELPGAGVVAVESVHPMPPSEAEQIGAWAAGLRAQKRADPDGTPRILAGDFNATLDHGELRRLIDTGYQDAASVVGTGLTPTWPYAGRLRNIAPGVAIDHVLVDRRIGVRDFRAFTVPQTDHRAILAVLVLRAA